MKTLLILTFLVSLPAFALSLESDVRSPATVKTCKNTVSLNKETVKIGNRCTNLPKSKKSGKTVTTRKSQD